jgi:hypothetical protein
LDGVFATVAHCCIETHLYSMGPTCQSLTILFSFIHKFSSETDSTATVTPLPPRIPSPRTARAPSSHAVPTEAPSPHTTPPGAPSPRAAPLGAPLRRAARMRPPRARAQGRQECGKLSPLPHELQPLKAPARGRQGCRELRPWPPPSELRPAVGPRSPCTGEQQAHLHTHTLTHG